MPQDVTIKIKGFYIGMDIQSLPALLREELEGKTQWIISDVAKITTEITNTTRPEDFIVSIKDSTSQTGRFFAYFQADPEGKVIRFDLSPRVVNDLFNSGDMDASDFVQQFIAAYHIPEMKVLNDNGFSDRSVYSMNYCTYTSPYGVRIRVTETKEVVVDKVAISKFD